MKDKMNGAPITERACLRLKMYSILPEKKTSRRPKAQKKYVVQKEIRHKYYKEVLFGKKFFRHEMNMLRGEGREIYGVKANKISLNPFDSKRYICENGMDTLAYRYRLTDAELEDFILELLEEEQS